MNQFSIKGVVARVEWSYYTAAALNGYTVTREREGVWRLVGTAVLSDAYKLSQRPLQLVAPFAGGEWRWPIKTIRIEAMRVSAELAEPLKLEVPTDARGNAATGNRTD